MMMILNMCDQVVPQSLRFRMPIGTEGNMRLGPAVVVAADGRHQAVFIGNLTVKGRRRIIVIATVGFDAVEAEVDEGFVRGRPVLLHIGTGMGQRQRRPGRE